MNYPNLFILGAPKCGTTALANWISSHPQIYVSASKEPHYFSEEYRLTPTLEQYLANFDGATPQHLWKCDASVWQMYSPTAVPNILHDIADPKFVVMVRNPIEMAPSMHSQQVFNGNEFTTDFTQALSLNDERLTGSPTGMLSRYPPDHLAYFHSCATGWQLETLLSRVPAKNVHLIFMDDVKHDARTVLRNLYSFLDLEDFEMESFPVVNPAKIRAFPKVDRMTKALGDWKKRHGIKVKLGVLSRIRQANVIEKKVQLVPPKTKEFMQIHFAQDIALLERLSQRDLSKWLET